MKSRATISPENFPSIDSPEWEDMNRRRAELIRKDIDQGLTAVEREEYEYLQTMSLETYLKAYPQKQPDIEGLAKLKEELLAASVRSKE